MRVPKPFRVGVVNPTQLYDNVHLLAEWNLDAWALSALRSIFADAKKCGLHVSVSEAVPDRVARHDGTDSLRGRSAGVAVLSRCPVFSNLHLVSECIRRSCRVLPCVLQIGHLPIRMVTVYCRPGSGTDVVAFNDTLLSAAVDLVSTFEGPCMITGDFNDTLSRFQSLQRIWDSGWRDLAVLMQERHGLQPQHTCKKSSRHSFVLGNPALLPLVTTVLVEPFLELDYCSIGCPSACQIGHQVGPTC